MTTPRKGYQFMTDTGEAFYSETPVNPGNTLTVGDVTHTVTHVAPVQGNRKERRRLGRLHRVQIK